MSKPITESALHFQLLIAGTIGFLVVFFSVALPKTSNSGQIVDSEWSVAYGLSTLAGYLAFVVWVGGHALLGRRDPPHDDA